MEREVDKRIQKTANRPFIDAQTVIKHYNWIWEDMTPTKHKLRVVAFEKLINE